MEPLSILETTLYVENLGTAEGFYRDVLGLSLDSKQDGRHVFFRCGNSMLLLFDPETTARPAGDVPTHGATGPGHVAFSIGEDDVAAWLERLAEDDVEIEASIDWPRGGRSIYFRDPAGNSVELASPKIWGLG
jgi:catechol 2,3-dioxygenase-like lactoylglutathione lyase family enzyme